MHLIDSKAVFLVNEAEAFAAKYVDTFRGLSAGCFHSCLLQLDGQLLLLGEAWQMIGMLRFVVFTCESSVQTFLGSWPDTNQHFCFRQIIFH